MITPNEVKEYLSQAYYTSQRIQTLVEKISEYRARAMRETPTWSETPTGGHAASSPQAVWIEKAVDLQEQWKDLAADLIERDRTAHRIIERLEDQRQKALLEDRHIWRLSWREISDKYHYSTRQLSRIMRRAYQDLAGIISADPELERQIKDVSQCPTRK